MKTRFVWWASVVAALLFTTTAKAQPIVDCNCLASHAQSLLTTNACQGVVPDLCQFTNCFSSTVVPPPPLFCSQNPTAGTVLGPGSHPITVTVTDVNGVGSQCVLTFNVNPPPNTNQFNLICAPNKTVLCNQTWTFDPPTPTNYCCPVPGVPNGGVSIFVINLTTNGTCPAEITQTWLARDACGKVAMCSQTVTQIDNVAPIIICAPNQTNQCNTTWSFGTPSATDNCTAPSDLSYSVFSTTTNFGCGLSYVAQQVWAVHDLCGNTSYCTQTVAVVDTVAPTIICGTNKTVECRTQWSFDTPTVFDNCNNAAMPPTNITVTVVSTVTNGFCPRFITRTWRATDGCGNSSLCSQTVTVVDTTAPVLDCNCLRNSINVPLSVIACSNPIPNFCSVIAQCAMDNCGPITCFQSPAAGTVVGPGVHPITITVYDCASNSASCVIDFVVTAPANGCTTNNCAVSITCPTNVVAFTCSNSAVVYYPPPTVINPCNSNVTVFCNPASGSVFPLGTTPVTCVLLDATGVIYDQCTLTVTVIQQTSGCPTNTNCTVRITCPTNVSVITCSNSVVVNYLPPTVINPCGSNVFVVCNPPSGSTFPQGITTVTCSVGVAGAISDQCTFNVIVTPPSTGCPTNCTVRITCPADFTEYTCSNGVTVFYPPPIIINPCNSNVTMVCNPPSGSFFPVAATLVTCSLFNNGVQIDQCTFSVIVTPPPGGCCTNQVRVWNTGMGGNGNFPLPTSGVDPNYQLVSIPPGSCTGPAQVINPGTIPGAWIPNGPNSQWIGAGPTANCQNGVYRYRIAFELKCVDGAAIMGQWTADDWAEMYLNGQSTGFTVPSVQNPNQSFAGWHPILITNGFICGTNYLDLVVTNAYQVDNPTGLRAELTNIFNECCCVGTNTTIFAYSGFDPNFPGFIPWGSPDNNYTFTCKPPGVSATSPVVINPGAIPGSWYTAGGNSSWIGPNANNQAPPGTYCYTYTFDVPCPPGSKVQGNLSGVWTADDTGVVFLNGSPAGTNLPAGWAFTNWHPINITSGFVAGLNTLTFVVTNWGGPTGIRLQLDGWTTCCDCTNEACVISIECPTNMTVFTCSSNAVVNFPNPTLINPCGSNVSIVCIPPSGSAFPIGTTPVTCFVGDATGVIYDRCDFDVTVVSSHCDFVNGNFNTQVPANGSGGGWTAFDNFGGAGWDPSEGNGPPSFLLNNVGDPATDPTISQRLCCFVPGQCYTIRGQRKVQQWFGDTNLSFAVLLDAAPILQLPVPTIPPDGNWHDFSVSFTATSACHTIGFAAEINGTDVSYWLDNLRIECCSTNTQTNCLSIICPADVYVTTCFTSTSVTYPLPVATNTCGVAITSIVCNPPSGSSFPVGATLITCTATDAQGNTASCNFSVVVIGDSTPPNCPPFSMSVTGCPPRMPNFQTNGLITDNCSPSALITVSQNIPPGTPLTPGSSTVVILTICDAAGNCRICDVQVTAYANGQPPKIKCPKDITVLTCSNSATVNYKVSANVPPAFINCTPPSGSIFPIGTNIVICTATNACGVGVSCSFKIIVKSAISVNPNVTITAGLPDNFALPTDTAFRTACLTSAFSGFTGWKNFDATPINTIFGHRFTGLPANIAQAELIIRMRPGASSGSDNDGLFVGLPSSCAPGSWSFVASVKTIGTAVPPTGGTWVQASNGPTTFTINLSTPAWLAKLNTDGFLDIAVHDDTTVDFARLRIWTCPSKHIGIGIPFTPIGNASVKLRTDNDDPDVGEPGPAILITPDPEEPQSGVLLEPGSPGAMTFTTHLPFTAPDGAEFTFALASGNPDDPAPQPLFTFRKVGPQYDVKVAKKMFVADSGNFRAVAIGTNGHLFTSMNQPPDEPDIDDMIRFNALDGVSNMMINITVDCLGQATFEIPHCLWTPALGRKGWDGCIYGNSPPGRPKGKGTARMILGGATPVDGGPCLLPAPYALVMSGLSDVPVENPDITSQGRKWGDGHVTLMKAYDDDSSAERRIEWTSFGEGGGVHVDLGRAATFSIGMHHFENGDIPNEEQIYRLVGPLTLTNRPTPPKIPMRVAPGAAGDEYSIDFSEIGATAIRVELWSNGVLVGSGEGPGAAIPPSDPLIVSGKFSRLGNPLVNEAVIDLKSYDLFVVSGLTGDQIRIVPIRPPNHDPLPYWSRLEVSTSEGMESMAYGLQRTLACNPGPLSMERTSDTTTISWTDDGFRLQGAEQITGPWYDLGPDSPVVLPLSEPLRYFRLICD